jgi:hypothetical protein
LYTCINCLSIIRVVVSILGDRVYDSDKLDKDCKNQGITLVAYHKYNRKNFSLHEENFVA